MAFEINRKQFLQGAIATGAVASAPLRAAAAVSLPKRPRAIAMWDFSWSERRWPGAGYEDWDQALDELVERGYDAVRIEAYPQLIAADPNRSWLLKPVWDTQDWGAPALVRVQPAPDLHAFIAKCRDRGVKVGLSTWFREDEDNVRLKITRPQAMADVWNATLGGIEQAGLMDAILYVDLCNEWPGPLWAPFLRPPLDYGQWPVPRAMAWMQAAVAGVRAKYPDLPLLFSTNGARAEDYVEHDLRFVDAIEHHVWMATENGDEFYNWIGYGYERFSEDGYRKVQRLAADLYAQKPAYWRKLLTDKIAVLAKAARQANQPLMTTECWAIVDYKDWPLLPWDWVKDVCALGTLSASATGQWAAIATSNFCGPQFRGMWRDVDWHRRLTTAIRNGPMDASIGKGRLLRRL